MIGGSSSGDLDATPLRWSWSSDVADPEPVDASAWVAGVRAELGVLGVPVAHGAARAAPGVVRDAIRATPRWDARTGADLGGPRGTELLDLGDVELASSDVAAAVAPDGPVERATAALEHDRVHLLLGGDGSVTAAALRGRVVDVARTGVIVLSPYHAAHADEATPGRRSTRELLRDGVDGAHVVQIGIGLFANEPDEATWCNDHGVRSHSAEAVHHRGLDACLDDARVRLYGCDELYVSVDLDVLDASHAPGCPGALPGGLLPAQLVNAMRQLGRNPSVRTVELLNLDPDQDERGLTGRTAALLVLAFAAGVALRR